MKHKGTKVYLAPTHELLKLILASYHYVIFCTSYCIYEIIYQGLPIWLMAYYLFHFLLVFISFLCSVLRGPVYLLWHSLNSLK